MPPSAPPGSGRLGFGEFTVDLASQQLSRAGVRVPLQQKAFLVLRELTRRPHEVVTRDELVSVLWPEGYFVDAEHGVNTAVRRLREALGDSAAEPRWIETLPRVGYRFIADVQALDPAPPANQESATPPHAFAESGELPAPRGSTYRRLSIVAALLVVVAVLPGTRASRWAAPRPPMAALAIPGSVEDLLARARYLRNVKRPGDAMRFVEQAQALAPGHPQVLAARALGLLGEGRDEEARALALRALALDDRTSEAHRVLGTLAIATRDFKSAEAHLRRAAATSAVDARSHTRLARHLLEVGRFDEARTVMLDARRIEPDDPDVQNLFVEHALRTGDFAGAVRQAEQWLAIWAPQIAGTPTPIVLDLLGLAYLGAGREDEALETFRAIDPGDDLRAALVHAHAGRATEARRLLARYDREPVTRDPGRDGAMAMAYVALGDHERALVLAERQRAGGMFPAWIHCRLFDGIRRAAGYGSFARRLEEEYFGGREGSRGPAGKAIRAASLGSWPRPARGGPG